jgi:uncharacterized protein (TIGR02646 family)
MIKIDKGPAPASLIAEGKTLTDANKADFLLHRTQYKNGTKAFTFTNAYKTDDVKNGLLAVQFNKCCFCEAKFVNDYFHVEHFRPKGRVDPYPTGPYSYPGYYWLAYEWSNLFLAKGKTNVSFKKNYFPLSGRVTRNRTHLETKIETSLLIDPGIEDPRDHIRFKKEEIVGRTTRGKKNITFLDLRNPQIDEARRTKYVLLNDLKTAIELLISGGADVNDPSVQGLINTLRYAITPEAEFSSMAIDLLLGWPHL